MSIHTFPLADYMTPMLAGRWDDVGRLLLASARKLAGAGAELLVCPDNSVHPGLELVANAMPVPCLHIAEEVAAVASDRRFTKLGITGTRTLMESRVYPGKLGPRGIAHEIPDDADRQFIDDTIFNELVYGRFEAPARRGFQAIIDRLAARGCDAVVLGCTEIPLLIAPDDSSLPVLDSTRLLARAALREALRA